jgi:hypothetical protein
MELDEKLILIKYKWCLLSLSVSTAVSHRIYNTVSKELTAILKALAQSTNFPPQ